MDIIPSDLNTYGGEAKRLLEDLQSRNERMFLVTVLFLNTAQTKQELENVVFQTAGIAQKYNCALKRLDYQQEPGLMSCLPLGMNLVPIKRALTTTSTAIFVPFTTQELFMGGESIYYGLNALSNNLIMADRKKLKNPNGLILGTPGSGKSFAAKREIANAFIVTRDDIIVCDPEGEYYPLVRAFHGQVIRISPTSHDYINPMDINLDYADDDDPLSLKSDFATAQEEVKKPFPKETELNEKMERLSELNALLNMDEKGNETILADEDIGTEKIPDRDSSRKEEVRDADRNLQETADKVHKPSILERLKQEKARQLAPKQTGTPKPKKNHEQEL